METPISSYIVDLMVRVLTLEPHFAEVPRGRRKNWLCGMRKRMEPWKNQKSWSFGDLLVTLCWYCADIVVILWWYCGDMMLILCWYSGWWLWWWSDEHEKTGVWRLISNMMRICCVPLGATKGRPRNPPPAPRPGTRSGRVSSARRTDRCLSARLGTGWKQRKHWGYLVICPIGMEHLDEKLHIYRCSIDDQHALQLQRPRLRLSLELFSLGSVDTFSEAIWSTRVEISWDGTKENGDFLTKFEM